MIKKLNLSLAIASSLGLLAQPALATTDIDFNPGESKKVATFASELPVSTTNLTLKTSNAFQIRIPVPTYPVDVSNPFFIKLAILGGAKFKSLPTVYCAVDKVTVVTGSTSATVSANTGLLLTRVVGAAGSDKLTYQLTMNKLQSIANITPFNYADTAHAATKIQLTDTITAAGFGAGCLVSGLADIQGLSGLVTQELSARVESKDGSTPISKSYKANLITFKPASKITYDASQTKVSIDVAQSSSLFTTDTKVSINTAYLGTVIYGPVTTTLSDMPWDADGENIKVTSIIANDSTLTVAGPALAAIAESTVSGVVNAGAIYLVAKSTVANKYCQGTALLGGGEKTITTAATVSFTTLAATDIIAGVDVCLKVDGNNPLVEGQITAILTAAPKGINVPVTSTVTNLVLVEKDGASAKVLNIPGPTSSDKPFIRINNMSAQAGKVFGTLYNQDDGAVIGTPNVEITNLPAFGVDIIDAGELAVLVGVEGWPKRAWLQLDAELTDMAVQGLMRTPGGVLNNLSGGTVAE